MAKKDDLPDLGTGRVRLTCGDPDFRLDGWLGPDSPRYTGGFGGWNVTSRPRQIGMVTYDGQDPLTLEFQMLWDGVIGIHNRRKPRRDEISIEPHIRELMAVVRGDAESPPGIVRVEGIPHLIVKRWVITNVEFGDAIRRTSDMHRIRLLLTFTLLEYTPPHFKSIRKGALGKSRGKTVTHRVKKGETPHSIAKRQHCSWTDIRKLNQGTVRRANQNLKDGIKIRVPARKSKGHH